MKRYKPSQKVPVVGLVLLLVTALVSGVVVGLLLHLVGRLVYIPLLFPILAGLLAGAALAAVVKVGKVRNPIVAVFFSVVAAVAIYGAYYYADYRLIFQSDLRDGFKDEYGIVFTDEEYQDIEKLFLEEETGESGFYGYMLLNVEEGFNFTSFGRSSSNGGLTARGLGVYIYWLLELVITTWAAGSLVIKAARLPFCEEVNDWYGKEEFVGIATSSEFLKYLDQGQFSQAGPLLHPSGSVPAPFMYVTVQHSTSPVADVILNVQNISTNKKGATVQRVVRRGVLSPTEFSMLKNVMGNPLTPSVEQMMR